MLPSGWYGKEVRCIQTLTAILWLEWLNRNTEIHVPRTRRLNLESKGDSKTTFLYYSPLPEPDVISKTPVCPRQPRPHYSGPFYLWRSTGLPLPSSYVTQTSYLYLILYPRPYFCHTITWASIMSHHRRQILTEGVPKEGRWHYPSFRWKVVLDLALIIVTGPCFFHTWEAPHLRSSRQEDPWGAGERPVALRNGCGWGGRRWGRGLLEPLPVSFQSPPGHSRGHEFVPPYYGIEGGQLWVPCNRQVGVIIGWTAVSSGTGHCWDHVLMRSCCADWLMSLLWLDDHFLFAIDAILMWWYDIIG